MFLLAEPLPKDKLEIIISYLYITITQEYDVDFIKTFDGSSKKIQTFLVEAQENLDKIRAAFVCVSILVSILSKKDSERSCLIREDVLDHGMKAILKFVMNLSLNPEATSSEKPQTNKKNVASVLKAQLIMEACKSFAPIFSCYFDSLCLLLSAFKQSEKVTFHVSELIMGILRIDTTLCDIAVTVPPGFIVLQREAIRLLQCISGRYSHLRQSLIMELLPLLTAAYSPKTVNKLYCFSDDANNDENRITMTLAALLRILQSPCSAETDGSSNDFLASYRPHCALVCREILNRATHKDMCATYRQLTLRLVADLLNILTNADFIVASLLLEILVRMVGGRLQSITNDPTKKRDISFFNFLLDFLGACGAHISGIVSSEKSLRETVDVNKLPAQLRDSIMGRVAEYLNDFRRSQQERGMNIENASLRVLPIDMSLQLLSGVSDAAIEATVDHKKYFGDKEAIALPNPRSILRLAESGLKLADRLSDVDEIDVHFNSLTKYLKLKGKLADDALELLLCTWISNANQRRPVMDFVKESLLDVKRSSNLTLGVLGASKAREERMRQCYSQEWMSFILQKILADGVLNHLLDLILGSILLAFTEGSPLIRARAMKSLSSIIRIGTGISSRAEVQETIKERLHDSAICVREETIKLIGLLFLRDVDGEMAFLDSLVERLNDPGVSVRKAVVSIIRNILESRPDFPEYIELSISLLRLCAEPKEEDSVRDLIRSTFQHLWFLPPRRAAGNSEDPDFEGQNVDLEFLLRNGWNVSKENYGNQCDEKNIRSNEFLVGPDGKKFASLKEAVAAHRHCSIPIKEESKAGNDSLNTSVASALSEDDVASIHLEAIAMQIAGVACQLKDPQWLISIIRDTLYSKAEGSGSPAHVSRKRQASLIHCGKLMASLVELLVRCEETLANAALAADRQTAKHRLLSILLAISLLSRAHPPFLLPYAHLFLPYMKGENGLFFADECLLLLSITEMIEAATVVPGFSLGSRLNVLNDDLVRISLKFSNANINAAVNCMVAIAVNMSKNTAAIMDLGERCFRSIKQVCVEVSKTKTLSLEQSARLQRCLVVLGYISEHTRKFSEIIGVSVEASNENETSALSSILSIENFSATVLSGVCYSAINFCLQLKDKKLYLRSTQALCSVFLGCPKLIILANTTGLLRKLFGEEQEEEIHYTLLTSLKNMMLSEERRLDVAIMRESISDAAESRAPSESDSDFTPAGFVLQEYLPKFLAFLQKGSPQLRVSALELISTLLRQGMLCPLDVISPLVALQRDADPAIREESLRLLINEEQRHPRFLESKILEGVDAAYDQMSASENGICAAEDGVSVFSKLYSVCLSPNRRRRNEFLSGLLKRSLNFCIDFNEGTSATTSCDSLDDLHRNRYVVSTLAMLSYQILDEPLYVVHWISRNVPVTSAILAGSVRTLLAEMGSTERVDGMMQGPYEGTGMKNTGKKRMLQKQEYSNELLIFDPSLFSSWLSKVQDSTRNDRLRMLIRGYIALKCIDNLGKLKIFLKAKYGLTNEQCLNYTPEEKVSAERIKWSDESLLFDLSRDEAYKSVESFIQSDFNPKTTETLVRLVTALFNNWHVAMDNESNDFDVSKKRPKRGEGRSNAVATAKKNPKSTTRKVRMKPSVSDDEDIDDSSGSEFED